MYCPECGIRIDDESALFCAECGTRVRDEVPEMAAGVDETSATNDADFIAQDNMAYGILLTNLTLLAQKLHVAKNEVERLIQAFISVKKEHGVAWRLVDAGDYTYYGNTGWGRQRTVRLGASDKLGAYMDILMDVHQYEQGNGLPESQYLFIIGGDDIIPMPCVRHYFPDPDLDKTIDTDLLYAYPYGEEMIGALESRQIFCYEPLFMVGRLPLAEDAVMNDLVGYLQRSIDHSHGIPVYGAYGQCDPHWKNVSVRVADDLIQSELLPNREGQFPPAWYYHRVMLSPEVVDTTVEQVLNTDATLYFFNLHGSDAREARGYFGVRMGERGGLQVIRPEHLAMLGQPNVVMTEACYGARFIGLDKAHSMLLTAMSAQTLAFVGSSRTSYGNVDPNRGATPQNVGIGLADVIAAAFMRALLQGYSVGQAFYAARCNVFKAGPDDLKTALTLVEFNLFGDPTLGLAVPEYKKMVADNLKKADLMATEEQIFCQVEAMKVAEPSKLSILNRVRSAVDSSIAQIRQSVADHLYACYGIEPRPADRVLAMRYADGREEMQFHYCTPTEDKHVSCQYIVTTTKQGEIKNVYASR